jgi:prepilin-type processing-associated H-X9-DG protein
MRESEPHRRVPPGFTLVELLVVIGVIVLLIALLMPALSGARDAANRAKCLSTLRSMHQAAHMHTLEHHGYMPVAGHQGPFQLGVSATDVGLGDPSRRRYFYNFNDGEAWRPDPLPIALAHYMGMRQTVDNYGTIHYDRFMATAAFRAYFTCPAEDQDLALPGYTLTDASMRVQFSKAYMSYIFNGAFLGRIVYPWGETPAGRVSAVRRPTEVFLFADGTSGRPGSIGEFGVPPDGSPQSTLYDAGRSHLDFQRHRGRINVMFVDGHGETLMLPPRNFVPGEPKGDLGRVGLTKGIFD